MQRFLVFDRDQSGNAAPVQRLWAMLLLTVPDLMSDTWTVLSSYGYGDQVCRLEEELTRGPVTLSGAQLAQTMEGDNQYYDGVFRGQRCQIMFGVKDSTYLFVETNNPDLEASLRTEFVEVRVDCTTDEVRT